MYIDVIELLACSVRTGKILVSFFFCKFMDRAAFEFPDGTAHLIGETRTNIRRQKFVFITPFLQNFCQNFWSDNKKKVST